MNTRDGDIAIRPMRDEPADYRLMSTWLSDERVLQFYGGRDEPYDFDKAVEDYGPKARGDVPTAACLLELERRPIGYLQYYRLVDWPEFQDSASLEPDPDAYGLDTFIGEPELWDRGLGTRAVRLALTYLFDELHATRVALTPLASNERAIRCYEKCGFEKVRLVVDVERHEGEFRDAWLMIAERERVRG